MGDLIFTILGGSFLFFICKWAGDKRSETTCRCPHCGTLCHASRWSTGLHHRGGGEVCKFTCPNCGERFYD